MEHIQVVTFYCFGTTKTIILVSAISVFLKKLQAILHLDNQGNVSSEKAKEGDNLWRSFGM